MNIFSKFRRLINKKENAPIVVLSCVVVTIICTVYLMFQSFIFTGILLTIIQVVLYDIKFHEDNPHIHQYAKDDALWNYSKTDNYFDEKW